MARRPQAQNQQELPIMNEPATATKSKKATAQVATSKGAVSKITSKQALDAPATPKSTLQIIAELSQNPNVDPDKIDRLLQAQERLIAREAEVQFNLAMHEAQSHMPRVVKDKSNNSTKSKFASLEAVVKTINPVIYQHGFAPSFGTEESHLPGHYKVVCYLSHTGGHVRKYSADIPLDNAGPKGEKNKTDTHGFGSSMSYARRYLTILMFNVVVVDEDKDGNRVAGGSDVETITDKQADMLVDLIEDAGTTIKQFNTHFGIQTIGMLPADRFNEAKSAIANVKAQKTRAR